MAEKSPFAFALRLLAQREFSFRELVERLERKGFTLEEAHRTVDEMRKDNMQSDYRFAESLILGRSRKGYGPIKIENDLYRYKCEISAAEFDRILAEYDWYELAIKAAKKKIALNPSHESTSIDKLYRFLQYRGFDHGHIRHAMSAIKNRETE